MEADLAFKGIDLRDLWRRGSGMTPRRLWVLIQALPDDGPTWTAIRAEQNKALKPTPEQIRDRKRHYEGG